MNLQWQASGFTCEDAVICNGDSESFGRNDTWVAFFFSLIVSVICGEGLRGIGDFGMYVICLTVCIYSIESLVSRVSESSLWLKKVSIWIGSTTVSE